MYDSQDKTKKPKAKNSIGKSGGQLSLSAKANEKSGKYLLGLDTSLPEKFQYQDYQHDQDDQEQQHSRKMRTIRNPSFSPKENLPDSAGEFALDTGWSEIGFDDKKKEVLVSFQSNYKNENSRNVSEDRAKELKVGRGEKVLSNDPSFESGAMSMRTKKNESSKRVRKQWENASDKKEHNLTFDDVAPFHQASEQKDRLRLLKEMAKNSKDEKTEIQKAITGIQTYINKKNMTKINFENKFDAEIDKVREGMKGKGDDYILLKKKQLLAEDEEKSLENEINEKLEQTQQNEENQGKKDQGFEREGIDRQNIDLQKKSKSFE